MFRDDKHSTAGEDGYGFGAAVHDHTHNGSRVDSVDRFELVDGWSWFPMTMYGADSAELRRLASEFRSLAEQLESDATQLTRIINNIAWIGSVQAMFLGDWTGGVSAQLASTTEFLRASSEALGRNADEQDHASEARGRGVTTIPEPDPDKYDHNFLWFHWGNSWGRTSFPDTPLFGGDPGNEILPSDVRQGQTGDCYFVAALAAMAATPSGQAKLRSMIVDNGNGTFTVTFGDGQKVTVDNKYYAYTDNGNPVYAQVGDDQWVAVMEEAYAAKRGGYDEIGKPGWAADALTALGYTGHRTSMSALTSKQLEATLLSGKPIVLDAALNNKGGGGISSDYEDGHAFTVVDVTKDSSGHVSTITIRNPWGSNEGLNYPLGCAKGPDGTVTMTVETARKIFFQVEVGN